MIYFDSSYLIKCYLPEPGHTLVRQLARANPDVACCSLGRTECRAAVHRHLREGKLSGSDAQLVHQVMDQDELAKLWIWYPITEGLLSDANEQFKKLPPSVFLRTADALHLTCAKSQGLSEIYSNDQHLLAAASHFGLVGKNVI
jgi:predicted nucleic acid-binding protein